MSDGWGAIWATVRLPRGADVDEAFKRDNEFARDRELEPLRWRNEARPRVGRRRYLAVLALYLARKAAWVYDGAFEGWPRGEFGHARPEEDCCLEGEETDSWGGGWDGALGKAKERGMRCAVFRERLNGISNRLRAVGAKLKEKAARKIDERMEKDWGKLMRSIPITKGEQARAARAEGELVRAREAWRRRVNAMSPRQARSIRRAPRSTGLSHGGMTTGLAEAAGPNAGNAEAGRAESVGNLASFQRGRVHRGRGGGHSK